MGNPKKKYPKCGFCGVPSNKCHCGKSSSTSHCKISSCETKSSCETPSCETPSCETPSCETLSCACSSQPSCETVCETISPECSVSSDDDPIVRVEGFLQSPTNKSCVNTYLLASCADPCEYLSPPTIMLRGRDGSWHFPGEQLPGYPFWLLIDPNNSLLLAIPEQVAWFFPLGTKYILTFTYK